MKPSGFPSLTAPLCCCTLSTQPLSPSPIDAMRGRHQRRASLTPFCTHRALPAFRHGQKRKKQTSVDDFREIPTLSNRENHLVFLPSARASSGEFRFARNSFPVGVRLKSSLIPLGLPHRYPCLLSQGLGRTWAGDPEGNGSSVAMSSCPPWSPAQSTASPETLPWFILSNWAGAGLHSTNIYWVPITWKAWCKGAISVLFNSVNIYLETY